MNEANWTGTLLGHDRPIQSDHVQFSDNTNCEPESSGDYFISSVIMVD